MAKGAGLAAIALLISACSAITPSCAPPTTGDTVYIVEHGWHVEIGLPASELGNELGFYRDIFPGAKALMIGYGKKTFFIAPTKTMSEYVLGPFPGPAAIQVVGLPVMPDAAYPSDDILILKLSPSQRKALTHYIWADLAKDASGKTIIVAPSKNPDGLFYAADSEYNLGHTCNTWVVDALQAAGLPISADNVVFSGQAMARVQEASARQCRQE